ncbi:hypothetical protein SAMN06269185_3222 [Natronoarchaeum philippinense]|uniref:DUF8135 domain-containing protein n=1 Tax=Natronoarchaeum philippinense TaxID=558529 RepID=A0A285P8I5_NATPI|nr:hypothetical protein [Natronoarchaeum philippinense]SNZ18059.1 hypothetical protein SAMN06269185_3222 [Natronoarchaeum philippinense]
MSEESEDDLPDEPLADLAASVRDDDDADTETTDADGGATDDVSSVPASDDADTDLPPLPGETASDPSREGPLGDLAAEVDRRRGDADPDDLDDLFTSEDVADLDVDAVWDHVESGGIDVDVTADADDEQVIEKASFCQQCEFFAEPPAVGCEHDGTEILELVDTDNFRVRNCPKVAEEERLGDL